MKKYYVFSGATEVYSYFPHTKKRLTCASQADVANWIMEGGIDATYCGCFDTKAEAMSFAKAIPVWTCEEQAQCCKVVIAKYAYIEGGNYDEDGFPEAITYEHVICKRWKRSK